MPKKTYSDPNQFINNLKWKTVRDEMTDVSVLVLDCYKFKFGKPLEKRVQYDMLDFISKLELTDEAILRVCGWLDDNDVGFELKFQYDANKTVLYNWYKFRTYRLFKKILRKIGGMRTGVCQGTKPKGDNPS